MNALKKGFIWLIIGSLGVVAAACGKEQGAATTDKKAEPTAAANVNPDGYPISSQNIEITMMMKKSPNQSDWDKLWISSHLSEKLGGKIKAIEVVESTWNEKKNLAFATGELPDAFWATDALTPQDVATYSQQGLLIPLNDLMEKYAPNLMKELQNDPEALKAITSLDGKIYALPGMSDIERERARGRVWINREWLDKLGLKVPTTLDQFYDMLKAFKERDPNGNGQQDEIPFSGLYDDTWGDVGLTVLSALGYVEKKIGLDKSGNTAVYVPAQPEYKEYLTFMNKLYKEGLLDNEYFTHNVQTFRGKVGQMRIGYFHDSAHFLGTGVANYSKYISMEPLTSQFNDKKMWPMKRTNFSTGTRSFSITSNNKHPEATMRLFDYGYSPEGGRLLRFGPEVGVIRPDAGMVRNADGTYTFKTPEGVSSNDYRLKEVTNFNLPKMSRVSEDPVPTPEQKSLTDNIIEYLLPYGKPVYPDVSFTSEEQEKLKQIETDLETYVEQMEAKFIVGDTPISQWDEYIKTVQKIGADDLVKIYQTAFERWKQL